MPLLAPLPSLGGHAVFLLLIQIALLLLAARVGGEICRRLALPAVVGELAAGIMLGPSVLGHYLPEVSAAIFPRDPEQFHLLEVFGLMGMVLLLLLTGLETDLRLLRHLGRAALIASLMGMVFPFATGFGLGMLTPDVYLAQPDRRILFSFFLATAMAISAMPVIAKILMDLDLTRRNIGVVILSAGVVDDTVGWLVLSLIAGVATHGHVRFAQMLTTLGLTAAFMVFAGIVLYPAARWLLANITRRARTPDSDLVFLLVLTLACGATTEWIGIHAVFGAFIAGALFRQVPELKQETVRKLESFVFPVLAPIFFGTVGLKVNLQNLGGGGMLALVLSIACLGKLLGVTVGGLWGGLRFWESLSIAVAMNARGAMELVVATIGLSLGILNQQMFSIIVVVAIVTSFMAPLGLRLTVPKVKMTEEEQRRMVAERSRGVFDPKQVRVLVPTMGGPNSTGAIVLASGLAKRSGHPIEVLSVKQPVSMADRILRMFDPGRGQEKERPSAVHRALVDSGLPPTVREVSKGDVATAIIEEAKKGFDFVAMGASSHGGWLGGSVLEKVVREAPCHVVIVKARDAEQRYRRILVSFDGGVFSRVAVEFAVRYAEVTESEITVAVLGAPGKDVPRPVTDSGTAFEAEPLTEEEVLGRISPILPTIQPRPKVVHYPSDMLSGALAREASSGNYDLVVIGAENRAVQHRLYFGADNERLLRSSPITVALVVPNIGLLR
jgi:Kef-type K+ transport system membrane component KefB/nucleotide-binding universal stress UspA family protein